MQHDGTPLDKPNVVIVHGSNYMTRSQLAEYAKAEQLEGRLKKLVDLDNRQLDYLVLNAVLGQCPHPVNMLKFENKAAMPDVTSLVDFYYRCRLCSGTDLVKVSACYDYEDPYLNLAAEDYLITSPFYSLLPDHAVRIIEGLMHKYKFIITCNYAALYNCMMYKVDCVALNTPAKTTCYSTSMARAICLAAIDVQQTDLVIYWPAQPENKQKAASDVTAT